MRANNCHASKISETGLTSELMIKQLNNVHELPTLPSVARRVNDMLQDINTPAKELAMVIEKDQAIVPKLLKLVNSAFYGFSQKITSISHAVMLIGYNTVRNAVVSIGVIDSLELKNKFKGYDIAQFWNHAVAVATVSRHLDSLIGNHHKENSFTAGLIHDVGRILMANLYPDRFSDALQTMLTEEITLQEAEARYFPLQHDAIGGYLALRWNLPDVFCKGISFHHQPAKQNEDNELASIVHVSDALVHSYWENKTSGVKYGIVAEAWKLLSSQIEAARQWMPQVWEEVQEASQLLFDKE